MGISISKQRRKKTSFLSDCRSMLKFNETSYRRKQINESKCCCTLYTHFSIKLDPQAWQGVQFWHYPPTIWLKSSDFQFYEVDYSLLSLSLTFFSVRRKNPIAFQWHTLYIRDLIISIFFVKSQTLLPFAHKPTALKTHICEQTLEWCEHMRLYMYMVEMWDVYVYLCTLNVRDSPEIWNWYIFS